MHSEGERVFLTRAGEARKEVDLRTEVPGTSPLDDALKDLADLIDDEEPAS